MSHFPGKFFSVVLAGAVVAGMTGCGNLSRFSDVSTASSAVPMVTGRVHGGQAPVSGATVRMYAANATVSKGNSTMISAATTLADGSFTMSPSAPAACPTPQSLVYLVATGGNPGLAAGAYNENLAMMTLLGTCGSLTASTYVVVNELTTVAAVEALEQFMGTDLTVGATAANAAGLAGAFAGAQAMVDFSTGEFPLTFPAVPLTQTQLLLNTLADILAACVNSSGIGTIPCTFLLQIAPEQDTVSAMQVIAKFPANQVAGYYGLIAGTGTPFLPYLGHAPTDFTVATTYMLPVTGSPAGLFTGNLMTISKGVSLDISGVISLTDSADQVWVYLTQPSTYAGNPMPAGSLLVYSALTGNEQFAFQGGGHLYTGTGFVGSFEVNAPSQLAPQVGGGVWVVNSDGTLSNVGGSVASAVVKYPDYTPGSTTVLDNQGVNQTAMGVDPSGNVWSIGEDPCFVKFSPSGTLLQNPWDTPNTANSFCPPLPLFASPYAMTSDENGNVYMWAQDASIVGFTNAVFKLGPSGNLLSPAGGFTQGGFASTGSLVDLMTYDRTNDELWMINGGALDVIQANGTAISGSNGLTMPGGGVQAFVGMAVDGAGNLWMPDAYGGLDEFSPSGAVLSPNGTTPGQSGYHPAGLNLPGPISIDAYGNIWIVNWGDNKLIKVTGLAVPKTYQ